MKAMLSSGRLEQVVRRVLALHCPAPCKLLCGLPQIGRGLKRVVKPFDVKDKATLHYVQLVTRAASAMSDNVLEDLRNLRHGPALPARR